MAKSTDERETPQEFFEEQNKKWHFKLDAAALSTNTKVPDYLGPDHPIANRRDAQLVDWYKITNGPVWLNPPYSRGSIGGWLAKAEAEAVHGITTVVLLPVDTSTIWFHAYVAPKLALGDVEFLKGRLSFKGAKLTKKGELAKAKFANMLVIFRGKKNEEKIDFSKPHLNTPVVPTDSIPTGELEIPF